MNFTQMVTLFASKMAGGSDDDDVILASFEAFEIDGKIDADAFRHSLMTFGVKFSASEVDGPMNFTQMVTLFASKMAGGSDDDDVILASFEAFEIDGKID